MSEEVLKQFEVLTANYSSVTDSLAAVRDELKQEAEKLREKYKPKLKKLIDAAAESKAELEAAIVDNPELFVEPKTRTISGIKIGFRKESDELVYNNDEASIIALIKEFLPKKKNVLIKVDEKLVKTALKKLSAEELKSIDCVIEEGDDVVYIGTADSEIDKFIQSLTKDLED